MEQLVTSDFKLGIIAGGQLGKMLALAASNWDVKTSVMDPDANCPAATVCKSLSIGDYRDYDAVLKFGETVDMIALEIEHTNIEALAALEKKGKKVYPSSAILGIIQDKAAQKKFLADHGFPTSAFRVYESPEEIIDAVEQGKETTKFVQKSRRMGYDGQGVRVVKNTPTLETLLKAPSIVEDFVPFDKEFAVIVARNMSGEIKCYPAAEMIFIEEANLVDQLMCPSDIPDNILRKSYDLAREIAQELQLVGLLAIEMFLLPDGTVLVNEMAPRPHNSGHHTIEGCVTSQYEQLLRAIFDFPLGSTDVKMPSVMVNILGEEGHRGPVKYEGLQDAMALEGVSVHIYGKAETRPMRKMGHATVVNKDIKAAQRIAGELKEKLNVRSWKSQS